RFEGRSSLRTWTFSILVKRARTRGAREARTLPQPPLGPREALTSDDWCPGPGAERPATWSSIHAQSQWDTCPESVTLSRETLRQLDRALSALPPRQRSVVTMRDVCGMDAEEVCAALNISPANQRVLLHRARAVLREALAGYYHGWSVPGGTPADGVGGSMAADLSGRAALITGAASGIGRASALAFAAAGASVALVDIDAGGLAETAAAARKLGPAAEVIVADVTDLAAVTAAVARTVEVFGRLDAAHNNAGVPGPYVPLDEYSEADFLRVVQVDLVGVWRCMRAEIRHM